jgi:hypothetical protein
MDPIVGNLDKVCQDPTGEHSNETVLNPFRRIHKSRLVGKKLPFGQTCCSIRPYKLLNAFGNTYLWAFQKHPIPKKCH